MPSKSPAILVIGIGPHARTFYLPALREMEAMGRLIVAGLVDILPQQESIEDWAKERQIHWPRFYLPPFQSPLPTHCEAMLSEILAHTAADAIIISTGPLSHKPYALWGMQHGMHILLDKPVTAAIDAVNDVHAAASLEADYEELAETRASVHGDRAFVLCAHRRYHPGFDLALSLVSETARQTGCPVTNVHGYHSDGQWRLPEEILRQEHHSYHDGHGKVSHSGFHFLDMLYRFRKAGRVRGKEADGVEVTSAFLQPDGFLIQLSREDYRRFFGPSYDAVAPTPDRELSASFGRFGELDVEASFTFTRAGVAVGLASASLLHGGFSRRTWMQPGSDLYKGNGRVKHEQHRIHMGPFFSLQVHSCQAKDNHEKSSSADEEIGGNNHFEMWIFRNSGIIGGEPFERLTFKDLPAASGFHDDKLFIEQVKRGAVEEFLAKIAGQIPDCDLRSDLSDHQMPVRLMSGLYQSHVLRKIKGNPLVVMPWKE
jgi:predicted dehydrogenase